MGERFAGRTCVRRDSSEGGGAFARRARGGVAQTPQLSSVRPAAAGCAVGAWEWGSGGGGAVGFLGFPGG